MSTPPPDTVYSFPGWKLGALIRLYEWMWFLALPLVLLYFWRKGGKEPLYRQHWGERFGAVSGTLCDPVWVHSASLGEMRGAAPWVYALLDHGLPVHLTTLTPAGRAAAHRLFGAALADGRMKVSYLPLELSWAVRRFLRQVRPLCGVMTEIDTWPVLLATAHRCGVPMAMANAQYPKASFERDQARGGFRAQLFKAYDLVMCKSHLHAARFKQVGCTQVAIVGETRFDLPVSANALAKARQTLDDPALEARPVVCFASAIEGEDEIFIAAMQRMQALMREGQAPAPLFVYVPRSPQRFEAVADLLRRSGLRTIRRSEALDNELEWITAPNWGETDVLLGDSLGEMYFYLGLSKAVVVGSSFGEKAVHNIIEPLAIHKPVWTGPSVRGIEYPALEALESGVLHHAIDSDDLAQQLTHTLNSPAAYADLLKKTEHFNQQHAGSAARHMAAFLPWLHCVQRSSHDS